MASYRQLSKNNWQVNFEIGKDPITGSRKRTSKSGFKTKKEAISFASKYELELSKGLNVIDNRILFKDFITTWYNDYKVKTLSLNTKTNYESRINKYIIPYLGNIELCKINTATIQKFYNNLINNNLKPNSIKKIMEVLKGCFKYAKKLNLIISLPTDIETISQDKEDLVVWDITEVEYFLSEIKDSWIYIPTLIISLTGLRVGELCGLRWENVDLNKGIIYVREQVIHDKKNKTLIHTTNLKTKTCSRDISLPEVLVKALKSHKLRQTTSNKKGFVILDMNNEMCNPRNVSMNFSRAVAKYELPLEELQIN